MITVLVNFMFKSISYKLQQLQSPYFLHMYIHMTSAALLHHFVSLTYRLRLTDCFLEPFQGKVFCFDDIFETRRLILCQIQ